MQGVIVEVMADVADGKNRGLLRKILLEKANNVAEDGKKNEEAKDDGDRFDRIARHFLGDVVGQQKSHRNVMKMQVQWFPIHVNGQDGLVFVGELIEKAR